MNAMTEYYYAKEHEESTVERINDSYLEALNSLEHLEAENAKLRAERDEWHRVAVSKQDIIDHMRDTSSSNMRLRELIAGVHEALCADKAGIFHKLILANMEDDMRELGIEVD